jgi:hypothetical protein
VNVEDVVTAVPFASDVFGSRAKPASEGRASGFAVKMIFAVDRLTA